MERIGIYGGTFNPPHVGHMEAAAQAVKLLGLQKLFMIPDRIAPHKVLPADSPTPEQRLEMLAIGAAGIPGVAVSDVELRRQGTSYTYETVELIRQQHPDAELVLLMGTDMFASLHDWREPERILRQASIGVLSRGDPGEAEAISAEKVRLAAYGATVYEIPNQAVAISSTQLRRMLIFGCADPFLPSGVGAYIWKNRLYGTGRDYGQLPMEQLEQVVIGLLNPNRVRHVLGCRDTAVALAKRWGADETDAARAGILHDVTKALDGPLQLTLCREYGIILNHFSSENPKTLHALTGSLVAERIFGENSQVVSAIRHHTTGKANMNLLEKIIYVADYMEPNRDFPGVERLRELAFSDLDGALALGLHMTLEMLTRQGRQISPESQEAVAWLDRKTESLNP